MSNTENQSKGKESTELSLIINNSEEANLTNFFTNTTKGKQAVLESSYEFWYSKADTLEQRLVLTALWESACRIGEAVQLDSTNLKGRIFTALNNKEKHKCLVCGRVKASHTMKTKGTCKEYQRKHVETFKQFLISERFYGLIVEWEESHGTKLLPYNPDYYRKMLKKIHKDLSPHDFRRGRGVYLQRQDASKEIIGSALGHKGIANTESYMESSEGEAIEFTRKLLAGLDTRKVMNISVAEDRENNIADMRKVMREEIAAYISQSL